MGNGSDGTADDERTVRDDPDDERVARSDTLGEEVGEEVAEDPSDVIGLLGHFYRGQMDRTTSWRNRLDQTSYWAVTVIAALITWVFSSQDNPHYLLLIGMGTMVVFLVVEARRYRAYDVWRERVRLLEEDLFAEVFDPESDLSHREWRERLGNDLRNPAVRTPVFWALARRLRRIYYPLLLVLLAAWLVRISVFRPKETWRQTAAIFGVPGRVVVGVVGILYLAATAVVVYELVESGRGEFHERERDSWTE